MFSLEDNLIKIDVPFAIPFLGLNEPTTISINKNYLQFSVRLLVVFCSFLLFWPRVVSTWRAATGTDEESKRKEINERIAKLESERARGRKGILLVRVFAKTTGRV